MFGVLDKYIGRTIFSAILTTIFILASLSGIIKFVEQLRKVGDGDYTILGAIVFTLLTIPRDIEIFFPMSALLGILVGLGALETNNTLVVMQAAGFSRLQVSISVIKTVMPLVIITMIIGEWCAPVTEQWARNYRAEKIVGQSLMVTEHGLWVKDGNNFIHLQSIFDKNKIKDISIYQFDDQKKLQAIIFAKSGYYNINTHQWQLSDVYKSLINNEKYIINSHTIVMDWKTNLNPEKLVIIFLEPDSLSIRGLCKYIKYLKDSGQEASIYELSMWKKILSPLSITIMMLMALSFIFGPLRSVSIGIRILIGISVGFVFYLLTEGFCNLSVVYSIPPLISTILPNILFLVLSILLLMRLH